MGNRVSTSMTAVELRRSLHELHLYAINSEDLLVTSWGTVCWETRLHVSQSRVSGGLVYLCIVR